MAYGAKRQCKPNTRLRISKGNWRICDGCVDGGRSTAGLSHADQWRTNSVKAQEVSLYGNGVDAKKLSFDVSVALAQRGIFMWPDREIRPQGGSECMRRGGQQVHGTCHAVQCTERHVPRTWTSRMDLERFSLCESTPTAARSETSERKGCECGGCRHGLQHENSGEARAITCRECKPQRDRLVASAKCGARR